MKHTFHFLSTLLLTCLAFHLNGQCFSEQSFTTPGEHTYIVPGASSESFTIEIEARGGDGGDFLWGSNPQVDGGEGATMEARFIVNGGDELFIIVGQSGFDAIGSPGGGGGGGGSAVIINATDVLIAAAAGGGGGQLQVGFGAESSTNSTASGGAGPGTSGGGGFNEDGEDGMGGTGGGAGTLTAQGAGGNQGVVAGPGGDGFGGGAGGSGTVGGGGGGYQGGDGASGTAGNYGGMGGDSYITTSYGSTVLTTTSGSNGAGANVDGSVTITCIPVGSVEIAVVSQSNPLCFGENSGSIEVTGLGGVAPYTYTIDGGSSQDNGLFENLNSGTYNLAVEDGDGNTASVNVTITDPPEVMLTVVNILEASCFGGNDGSIEISGSGGTSSSGFYMYSIDGQATQNSGLFTGLAAGEYLMVVHDDNGCTIDMFVSVSDQPEIVVTITNQTDASCDIATNGTVTFSSTGGQGGFTYSLDGNNFQTPAIFNDLASGDYTATVQDMGGCQTTIEFTINVSDPFTFLILDTANSNCGAADGSVNMLATGGIGGYTYAIDGGAPQMTGSFAGLDAGTYTATATDGAGCSQDLEFTIGMDNNLDIVSALNNPTCLGGTDGSITLTLDEAGEPYNIEWTGENVIPTAMDQFNLGAGTYSVSVSDVNGCSLTEEYELLDGISLIVEVNNVQNVSCNGGADGAATVTTSNGVAPYSYSFDGTPNATEEFTDLSAGMYQIDVTDANGCTGETTIIISEPLAITISITDQTEAGCNGDTSGSATIVAENGNGTITYNLDNMTNETGLFDGLSGGSYTATATDESGCTAEVTVIIMQNSTLSAMVETLVNVSCSGSNDGSVTVVASAGSGTYSYAIDGGPSQDSPTFNGLTGSEYQIVISDTEGCSFLLMVTITESSAINLIIDDIIEPSCHNSSDGSASFHIEGGEAPYVLESQGITIDVADNTTLSIHDIEAGIYDVLITDAAGCFMDTVITIYAPDSLAFVEDYLTNVTCYDANDATFGFHIEGGTAPYLLTTEDGELEVLDNNLIELADGEPIEAELLITDANGCTTTYTLLVTEPDLLEFVINEILPSSCFGAEDAYISFSIIGGTGPYELRDEDGDILVIENSDPIESDESGTGEFPITITDANGCSIETIVTIPSPEELIIENILVIDDDGTGSGSITINAIGGTGVYSYSIGGDFQSDSTFEGLSEDEYEVTIMDENGCTWTETVVIVVTSLQDIDPITLKAEIHPNPASQIINVEIDSKEAMSLSLKLLDITGKNVFDLNSIITNGSESLSLDIEHLESGLYLMNIITSKGQLSKKIIIDRK